VKLFQKITSRRGQVERSETEQADTDLKPESIFQGRRTFFILMGLFVVAFFCSCMGFNAFGRGSPSIAPVAVAGAVMTATANTFQPTSVSFMPQAPATQFAIIATSSALVTLPTFAATIPSSVDCRASVDVQVGGVTFPRGSLVPVIGWSSALSGTLLTSYGWLPIGFLVCPLLPREVPYIIQPTIVPTKRASLDVAMSERVEVVAVPTVRVAVVGVAEVSSATATSAAPMQTVIASATLVPTQTTMPTSLAPTQTLMPAATLTRVPAHALVRLWLPMVTR